MSIKKKTYFFNWKMFNEYKIVNIIAVVLIVVSVRFSGVRPVAAFGASSSGTTGPVLAPGAGYSRESTPDSGGSHYMDPYRDPGGKYNFCSVRLSSLLWIFYKYSASAKNNLLLMSLSEALEERYQLCLSILISPRPMKTFTMRFIFYFKNCNVRVFTGRCCDSFKFCFRWNCSYFSNATRFTPCPSFMNEIVRNIKLTSKFLFAGG